MKIPLHKFDELNRKLSGEIHTDKLTRIQYATDASVYRELPLAVVFPRDRNDIRQLIQFASREKTSIIPRTAGTSLAGQCVGNGIVMDVSRFMNRILEVNQNENWVIVEPGVIRDELNAHLRPYGLFFGPNTSTANRAMIGGMVGNNSCGSYSIVYGTTRDHTLEIKALLSDGSEAVFRPLSLNEFSSRCIGDTLENRIYRKISNSLSDPRLRKEILAEFPAPAIHRRNTGYALDALLELQPFSKNGSPFNLCKLLCGSEGTLAISTEIKLNLSPLPPKETALICAHFQSVNEALESVITVMDETPRAVELMDKTIMDLTKESILHSKNRFFIHGDPAAILIIEIGSNDSTELDRKINSMTDKLKTNNFGYDYPVIYPPETSRVWDLRKAGLGLLSTMPGDAKPVAVIEDTAVMVEDQPAYIREFTALMKNHEQQAVYYAHAGAGELHLRPILNLKDQSDRRKFRQIATESADLVKKYNGSLSGEHGDGRLRAEFIPRVMGQTIYSLFKEIKETCDHGYIFNPGKIVEAPPMDHSLRYVENQISKVPATQFDFDGDGGFLRSVEKCNGSADCRKLPISGGTMCPSYMATRVEKDTTRARANVLREFLTHPSKNNPFDQEEILDIMDFCLACKGCKSECPSNVDMALMKSEFLYQYQKVNGIPFKSRAMANIGTLNKWGSIVPGVTNFLLSNKMISAFVKSLTGVSQKRQFPLLARGTLLNWYSKQQFHLDGINGEVYMFCDEFTNFNDVEVGMKAIQLLNRLGYSVKIPKHLESGRAFISKGLLSKAKKIANHNVSELSSKINGSVPLIGIEPSAILTFRDEYPRLVDKEFRKMAHSIAGNTYLIEEFLALESRNGKINGEKFTTRSKTIMLHGHCHQKALSDMEDASVALALPKNYVVEIIKSGCCGMAGSFGYERDHYDLSMKIGELVLFPAIRNAGKEKTIAASGTSCRHQIFDGTGKNAFHPAEILFDALAN